MCGDPFHVLHDFFVSINDFPCTAKEAIAVVKELQKTNIIQYLTPDVFASIMRKNEAMEKGAEKDETIKAMVELINGNWDGGWTTDEVERHNAIIWLASSAERDKIDENDVINVAFRDNTIKVLTTYLPSKQKPG